MSDQKWASLCASDLLGPWWELWSRGAFQSWRNNGDPGGRSPSGQDTAHSGSRAALASLLECWRALGGLPFGNPLHLSGLWKNAFDPFHEPVDVKGPTPCTVVHAKDRVRLMRYSSPGAIKLRHPLLVVYSLINRPHILDFQADRSLVRHLLSRGIDVYMIDWGYPTAADHHQSIDDHVNGYLAEMVDFIRHAHHVARINLMGVCMGGTLSVIYAALHAQKVANLITTVTPAWFDLPRDPLHAWLKALDVDAIVEIFGNMPGIFLVWSLLMFTPIRLLMEKYSRLVHRIEDPAFVESFLRLEKWTFDSPDIPGETFRQFIKDCYQDNLLIRNRMMVGERKVNLKNINMPLLNVFGKADHFVRPDACSPLTAGVASPDTRNVCMDTGHLGLFMSSRWQKVLSKQIVGWLAERDDASPPRSIPGWEKSPAVSRVSFVRRRHRKVRGPAAPPTARCFKGSRAKRTSASECSDFGRK